MAKSAIVVQRLDPSWHIAGILFWLQAAMIALRVIGVISWSWWFVLIPIEASGVVYVAALAKLLMLGIAGLVNGERRISDPPAGK